jgi:hypothetical protein
MFLLWFFQCFCFGFIRKATTRKIVILFTLLVRYKQKPSIKSQSIANLFAGFFQAAITPVVRPVIFDVQHGFVKGRSTVSNLVQFTNGVIGEVEDGW